MPPMNFNAAMHKPQYGGSAPPFPVGKGFLGVIVGSAQEPTAKGGGMLVFDIQIIEGPSPGFVGKDRLNIHHTDPKTADMANQQLSAYCHVLGVFAFSATEQLHNIPFRFDVNYQKGEFPTAEKPEGGYTQITALYDRNGTGPGKAPAAAPAPVAITPPPPAAPPAGVVAAAPGGWQGGAPAAAPAAAPPAAAPAWTPPAAAPAPAPAAAGWVAPAAAAPAAPAPGGWVAAPAAPAAAPGGWQGK